MKTYNETTHNVTILNTSILTNFGSFNYEPLTLEESKSLISNGFESAVGHQSTCDILSSLLEKEVKLNRIQYSQKVDDIALVFKLKGRPEEGRILTVDEIESIGYEFGKLTMTNMNRIIEKNTIDAYKNKVLIDVFNTIKAIQASRSIDELTVDEIKKFQKIDSDYRFWQ